MSPTQYNLRRNIDLLWLLTRREITTQYKRTFLGIFWSLLNPLLQAMMFYIAFIVILRVEKKDFPLFLLSVLFPWTWFSNSVSTSTVSLIANKSLIKKFPFPTHYLLTAGVLSHGVHFLFSLAILLFLVHLYGRTPHAIWLLGIPLLLLIQFILTIGVSLGVSVISVYFIDFQFIVTFLLNMFFWITPVVYQLETIPAPYIPLLLYMNPLTSLMSSWRELFLSNRIQWNWLITAFLFSLVIFFAGLLIFRILNRRVDEVL